MAKERPKQRQAASLSPRCRRRPATQHAISWSRINDLQILSNEFTNGYRRGQIDCSRGCGASCKDSLTHGTRIFVVRRMGGAGISRLIVSNFGGFRTVVTAMRRVVPCPCSFDRVEDGNSSSWTMIRRMLTPKVQHLRRWQQ